MYAIRSYYVDDNNVSTEEQLYYLNAMVDQIQRGNTEIAEAIRERVPMLEAAGLDPAQFGSILEQSNLASSVITSYSIHYTKLYEYFNLCPFFWRFS